MARNAEITLPWADGDHRFRLGIGELELLQEATDVGPYVLAERFRARARAVRISEEPLLGFDGPERLVSFDGEANPPPMLPPLCSLKEIRETLRLGLVGGGMKHGDALRLVRAHVEERPIEDNRHYAFLVIQAALYGAPEERVGEFDAPDRDGEESKIPSPTESSGLA
jgi:hypothetical protein